MRAKISLICAASLLISQAACGSLEPDTEDDLLITTSSLVSGMSYSNTTTGTVFSWTSDGSDWYRIQVPNHFVTHFELSELGCFAFGQICTTPALPLPFTTAQHWYIQGSIDAPYWAASSYSPTESEYQPSPPTGLAAGQSANAMILKWTPSRFASAYQVQVRNHHVATYLPADLNCDGALNDCELSLPFPSSLTGTWFVRSKGTELFGAWMSSTYNIENSAATLYPPSNLLVTQTGADVAFSWDRNEYASGFAIQIPNDFLAIVTPEEAGCSTADSPRCTLILNRPAGDGVWYIRAESASDVSPWVGSSYSIDYSEYSISPPSDLIATQVAGGLEMSWTKSDFAIEYQVQVVNNLVETISATELGCGQGQTNTCVLSRAVKPGSGNWYVRAHGTGLWTNWTPANYSMHECITNSDCDTDEYCTAEYVCASSLVTLHIEVSLPLNTPAGDTIYMGSNTNSWNPAGTTLTRTSVSHASVTLTMSPGELIEYKYTRGSWPTVEKDMNLNEIGNRTYTAPAQPGEYWLTDTVQRWADL